MNEIPDWKKVAEQLEPLFANEEVMPEPETVCKILKEESPANIALAMEEFDADDAAYIFNCLDEEIKTDILVKLAPGIATRVLNELTPEQLTGILGSLPPREAASLITEAPKDSIQKFLHDRRANPLAVHDAQFRLSFPEKSAGRLMTTQFLRIYKGSRIEEAINVVQHTDPKVDIPDSLYVIDRTVIEKEMHFRLLGTVSIRDLILKDPAQKVEEAMDTEVFTINANADETDAAALLSKYQFSSLPVVDDKGFLIGVIPADNLMQVVVAHVRSLYTKAVGTDAEKMENLSPLGAAKLRVPWLLGTMLIELLAGLVISHYDAILQKVILLASFMPVISAISGNVGLQAAAITVRAVDSGIGSSKTLWHAIKKEGATSLIMALVCGFTLGLVGAFWAKHIPFGLVIGGALTVSMLTAGFMGTVIPIFSKKLGFDPATTAGPFETAFQDIVGFGVFLWLATVLQDYLV